MGAHQGRKFANAQRALQSATCSDHALLQGTCLRDSHARIALLLIAAYKNDRATFRSLSTIV
eukprot:3110216-Amphidinium_carterae.1